MRYLFLIFTILLTSCTYLENKHVVQNRDTDYLKASSVPPLSIPPGLSSSTLSAHYPVSDKTYPDTGRPIDLTPPGL